MARDGSIESVMTKGLYNKHAQMQNQAMEPSFDLLVQAVQNVPINPDKPFQITDMGASQGANSMQPVRTILEALQGRLASSQLQNLPPLEVQVHHEDLPSNDFHSLLSLVNNPGQTYVPQPGQLDRISGVYSTCVGKSFYERLFPANTIHINFAFTTLHWLSNRPMLPRDAVFPSLSKDPALLAAFHAQAHSDLTTFLRHRAVETVPGGALIAHFPVRHNLVGWTLEYFEAAVQDHLAKGLLSPDDVSAMSSYSYTRREEEVKASLDAVSDLWEVKALFTRQVEQPYYAMYQAGEMSAEELARIYCRQREAVLKDYMVGSLAVVRGHEEAERKVSALFAEFTARMVAEPHLDFNRFVYFYLVRKA